MKNEYKIILILILIILFLLYTKKNEHLLVSNEPIINIAKVYADASGTVNFNNIAGNNLNLLGNSGIKGNLDVSGNSGIKGNLDVSGNARLNGITEINGTTTINGNFDVCGNISTKQKLLFQTDASANKWEGIHTFWMQSGWDTHQVAMIKNPDGESYNADKWVCLLSNNYEYQQHHGLKTFVDTKTNNWCIYKWLDLDKAAYVTVICYPRQMFSKVWTNKWEFSAVDVFNPSGSDLNTKV